MKIFGILISLILILVIGGFLYVANSDVSVSRTTITKDISSDQLK